jgi:hypothetical protein
VSGAETFFDTFRVRLWNVETHESADDAARRRTDSGTGRR